MQEMIAAASTSSAFPVVVSWKTHGDSVHAVATLEQQRTCTEDCLALDTHPSKRCLTAHRIGLQCLHRNKMHSTITWLLFFDIA